MNLILTRRRLRAASAATLLLASLLLASCGGSSSPKASTPTKAAISPDAVKVGAIKVHASSLSECLKKNGVALQGGSALPKGVTRSRYQQALKQCGVGFSGDSIVHRISKLHHVNRSVIESQLKRFAACMRENGVSFPEPSTSGKRPTFTTKGLNTHSQAFRGAESKCIADLRGEHRASPATKTTG